jgi:hypothetical protein
MTHMIQEQVRDIYKKDWGKDGSKGKARGGARKTKAA